MGRFLLSLARRLLVCLAWLVVVGAVGLLGLEESGILVDLLRLRLAWRLGQLGPGLSIEHVSLRWFEPGVVVEGITLLGHERDGVQRELLRLRSVHLWLSPGADLARPVQRLHVDGGRIRISDDLLSGFDRIVSSFSGDFPARGEGSMPRMLVTDVDVELDLPDHGTLALGRLDVSADPIEGGFDVRGRVLPSLSGAVPARVAVLVDGRLGENDLLLHASARDLPLETARAVLPSALADLPIGDFAGRLTLDGEARLAWGSGPVEARGELRASVAGTRWIPWPGFPALEEPQLEAEVGFHPTAGSGLFDRASWSTRARADGRWNGARAGARALLGEAAPEGSLAKLWAGAAALPLDAVTREALSTWLDVDEVWESYHPSGRADLLVDLSIPAGPPPSAAPPGAAEGTPAGGLLPDVSVWLHARGEAGVAFHGRPAPPEHRFGLPIPCEGVRGDLVFALAPRRQVWRLGLVDLSAGAAGGAVRLDGILGHGPDAEPGGPLAFDALLTLEDLEIGDAVRRALEGNLGTREIWPTYAPEGGRLGARWRLHEGRDTAGFSAAGEVRIAGARAAWRELPAPLANVSGALDFRWSERVLPVRVPGQRRLTRSFGVRFDFANRPAEGSLEPAVTVHGLYRDDHAGATELAPEQLRRHGIEDLRLEMRALPLRGRDWEILAARLPEIAAPAEELGAKGYVDVLYAGGRAHAEEPFRSVVEVVPGVVELTPTAFPRRTRELRGRILVRTTEGLEEGARASETEVSLTGAWPGDVAVAAVGRLRPGTSERLALAVAGIDPLDSAFRGALSLAASGFAPGTGEAPRVSEDALRGRLDFGLRLDPSLPADDPTRLALSVYLRDDALVTEGLRLYGLSGRLEKVGDALQSDLIHARIAGHPVELRDVRIFRAGDAARIPEADPVLAREGFADGPDDLVLQAELGVRNLPLDEAHLSELLDEDTLRAVEESVVLRGEIDVPGARLVLATGGGRTQLAARGIALLRRLAFRVGLPIEIVSAEVDVRELISEAGRLRGWGAVSDAQARIAGRELSEASMILSYVDGRLTIDELSGAFEGGRLSSLGGEGQGGTALAVDLAEPHGFDLRLALDEVRVDRLLKGVFHSSIADQGRLTLGLRLKGQPEHVLGIAGSGWLRLDEGQLWSIPVVREVFGQLGFDQTAVFDRLRARFQVREGRIVTSSLALRSSLLNLVGSGRIDLDGSLRYDLEVRYSLLDRLGSLNKLLYWLNNSLWRVAVRGDMDRPRVVIRNSFFEIMRRFREMEERALPLPDFSPLPARF